MYITVYNGIYMLSFSTYNQSLTASISGHVCITGSRDRRSRILRFLWWSDRATELVNSGKKKW